MSSKNHGKQLRLFLPDGTSSGPRYYELVNWTGQALQVPLNRIKDLVSGSWPEFQSPGIIAGGPRSGPEHWKNEAGIQLKDLSEAEEAEALEADP